MAKEEEQPVQEDLAEPGAEARDVDIEQAEDEQEPSGPSAEQIIEALSEELEELEDRRLRLAAEFDNFRKRTMRERSQHEIRAQAELIRQLLESLDDLSRVSEMGSTDHDAAAILEGVQLVELKLQRALQTLGLTAIDAVGQPFNPELHDAMITEATDKPEEDGVVSQELAKGYTFRDTLLRPSRVAVKTYRPEMAGPSEDELNDEDES